MPSELFETQLEFSLVRYGLISIMCDNYTEEKDET